MPSRIQRSRTLHQHPPRRITKLTRREEIVRFCSRGHDDQAARRLWVVVWLREVFAPEVLGCVVLAEIAD
jgi:hypothetical protein